MKTREDIVKAWNTAKATETKPWPSGYLMVPADWSIEELRQAARDGHIKLVAGRYQFIKSRVTPRDKGMAWRLVTDAERAVRS